MFLFPAVNISQGFRSRFRVDHVDGALIPIFTAPIVTKLYKFICLSIKNFLLFIRILKDKLARNYVAISSSLSPLHYCTISPISCV